MLVTSLNNIKSIYDSNRDIEKAISSISILLKKENNSSYDVVYSVFDDCPEMESYIVKAEWSDKIKNYYNSFKKDTNKFCGLISLFHVIGIKNGFYLNRSKYFIDTIIEIFDEENFSILESKMLQEKKEIMKNCMTYREDHFMTKNELIHYFYDFYKEEAENTYYENQINEILDEIVSELV